MLLVVGYEDCKLASTTIRWPKKNNSEKDCTNIFG